MASEGAGRVRLDRIEAAEAAISPVFLGTPQFEAEALGAALGAKLWVKVETLNPVRCFKGRGADWYMARHVARGGGPVMCASAGNFGQAIAWAGRERGVPVTVYAAENASPLKLERMRSMGAAVVLQGADFDAAKEAARSAAQAAGATFAEDSLDIETVEGAGSIGLELARLEPVPEAILVPLGNGAMLNGIGHAMKQSGLAVEIIAVQAEGAPAMVESWRSGETVTTERADTIADGIAVRVPVPQALADMAPVCDRAVLVSEAQIVEAMRLIHTHLGLVTEPSGAAGVAALLAEPELAAGRRVAIILCGGNLTPGQMRDWLG